MTKLQKTAKREVGRIALGVCLGSGVMILVYLFLKQLSLAVALGTAIGSLVAIGNFYFLAVSVQKAAGDLERAKNIMKSSYSMRMLISAMAIGAGLLTPFIEVVPLVIPLLLPRATIYVLQFTGAYRPEKADDEGGET